MTHPICQVATLLFDTRFFARQGFVCLHDRGSFVCTTGADYRQVDRRVCLFARQVLITDKSIDVLESVNSMLPAMLRLKDAKMTQEQTTMLGSILDKMIGSVS